MYKYQSISGDYLESLEHAKKTTNDEMNCLQRQVLRNLTRNVIESQSKRIRPLTPAQKPQTMLIQNQSTYKKQKLLRFPAIPLNETLPKFLRTVEPLLDRKEYEKTKCMVEEFQENEGPILQKLLEKASETEDNWLARRWLRAAYLQYRDPVAIYVNPGMTFPLQTFEDDDKWLEYTSKVIYGLIKFKQVVDDGKIPVVKMGKLELDNSQFHVVYGTCRIPKPKEDGLEYNPDSKHVTVLYRNHFYKLAVYDKNGTSLAPEVLVAELKKIVSNAKGKGAPIGILTTNHRDCWAKAYAELINSVENEKNVKVIQKSLFTVSLDEPVPCKTGKEWDVLSEQLMYGGGSCQNSANRWMDKTIQLISNPNGMSGFCYEHSPAEGQPVAQIVDYVLKNFKDPKFYEGASCSDYDQTRQLNLKCTPCLQKLIDEATAHIDKLGENLQVNVLHFQDYGKGFLKEQKLSPDSFIQIALQYAFYRLHRAAGAQYESAHLRIYYGGRTETIRSCSNESIAFAKAMLDDGMSDECRVDLLREAVKGHREYTTMALQGRGVDRHLLGLKLMAIENNLPIPELYSSPGWVKGLHFRVSTSQVATPNAAFMVYGPAVDNGYACCYNPRERDIILAITAWRSNEETCADKYAESVGKALCHMQQVLLEAGHKKNSKL